MINCRSVVHSRTRISTEKKRRYSSVFTRSDANFGKEQTGTTIQNRGNIMPSKVNILSTFGWIKEIFYTDYWYAYCWNSSWRCSPEAVNLGRKRSGFGIIYWVWLRRLLWSHVICWILKNSLYFLFQRCYEGISHCWDAARCVLYIWRSKWRPSQQVNWFLTLCWLLFHFIAFEVTGVLICKEQICIVDFVQRLRWRLQRSRPEEDTGRKSCAKMLTGHLKT